MKQQLMDLMGLCYEVTNTTEHDVFFYYYGHTNTVDIDVHRGGWVKGRGSDDRFKYSEYDYDSFYDFYKEVSNYLQELL